MSTVIPTFQDLSFYSNPDSNKARYESLKARFELLFKQEPKFFSRSPGRVNLIGDHIDYSYFSVLPMAIDVDVVAAVGISDVAKINLTNMDSKFEDTIIELPKNGEVIDIDHSNFSWASYFKCGLIVAHKYILEKYPELVDHGKKPLKGLNLTFDGTVPTGGGLSSSAAFCVCSTLAILKANGINEIPKEDLTKITVVSEHYVGVNTGGMDQCASIYGEKSKALLINFRPKLIGVPFEFPVIKPNDMVFLISNSLFEANKHETAPINYNLRVVEVAVSSELLAKKFNLSLIQDSNLNTGTLRGFMDTYFTTYLKESEWDGTDIDIGITRLSKLLNLIEDLFTDEEKAGFKTSDVAEQLGLTEKEFELKYLTKFPVRYENLKLYQRTKHVFSDSLRVLQTLKLLRDFDGNSETFLRSFGDLMNDSQVSADIYNNSSNKQIDMICKIARENGSYGSRVTGAGWGGSVVHLTTSDKVETIIDALKTQYYQKEIIGITEKELEEAIVISKPATGTCIVEI